MNNSIHIDRICNISRVSLWFESSLSSPLKLSNLHQQYCYYLIYLSKANMQTKPSLVKYWTKLACKGNEYISTHTHPPTHPPIIFDINLPSSLKLWWAITCKALRVFRLKDGLIKALKWGREAAITILSSMFLNMSFSN